MFIFTFRAESHPHGAILADIREPGGQTLGVEWCPILLKPIQEQTRTSVMDLEISQSET